MSNSSPLIIPAHDPKTHPSTLSVCLWLQLDLSSNQLCGLYYDHNGDLQGTYTAKGITAIANALKVTASLESLNLFSNMLDVESAGMLLKVKAEKPTLRTLCGLTHEETQLNLSYKGLGAGDAKLLAPEISIMASLTSVR